MIDAVQAGHLHGEYQVKQMPGKIWEFSACWLLGPQAPGS